MKNGIGKDVDSVFLYFIFRKPYPLIGKTIFR